jgi:hypothetical protein
VKGEMGSKYSGLIKETIGMMKLLNIRVRDSIAKDGALKIGTIDTIANPFQKGIGATFARAKSGRTLDSNGDAVKYMFPIIYVTHFIDSILSDRKDTSKISEVYARSVLVHELTHYLQKTVTITYGSRGKSLEEYINLPDENEGLSIHAYYFLRHYSPNTLVAIQQKKMDTKQFRLSIINAMYSIFDNNRRKLNIN